MCERVCVRERERGGGGVSVCETECVCERERGSMCVKSECVHVRAKIAYSPPAPHPPTPIICCANDVHLVSR